MRRIVFVVAMALGGGSALAAGEGNAPSGLTPGAGAVGNEGERGPTLRAPSRVPPASGTEGSVSDWAGAREPGGNSTTRRAGGINETGGPDSQASGQSGTSVYPY